MFLTLMYHIVDGRVDSPIAISEERFEEQLRHIRSEGYRVLCLDEVVDMATGDAPVPERALFLTFDDGYTDNLHAALPRLREHGFEATMFVPTKYLGRDNGWNALATCVAHHLDWDGIERWLEGGGRVGGHTHGHEDADAAPSAELCESILLNRRLLSERLGLEITAFAYPYGHFTPEARATVASEYRIAFSTDRGTWDVRRDRFTINRMNAGCQLPILDFALELERHFDELAVGRRPRAWRDDRTAPPAERRPSTRTRSSGPRIALVAGSSADVLGYPVEARFVDLLDRGWDVHLIHDRGLLDLAGLRALDERTLRQRLHPPPVSLRRWYPRSELVTGVMRSAVGSPSVVARTVLGTDDRAHRYRAATLLAIRPDLVHVPRGAAGARWLGLREATRARFVGPAGAGLPADGLDAPYLEFAGGENRGALPVIPPAVDELVRGDPDPYDRDSGRRTFRIVAAGELSWQQGYEHLLHAVRLLEDRGVTCECRIVGSGRDEGALTFARHQLGLLGAVDFFPAGDTHSLVAHLRWADVLVDPAVVPARPWSFTYAHALGVPVVTTPPPSDGGEPSLVVGRRDPVGLADTLERVATDRRFQEDLANAAAARASTLPTLDEQLRLFRELYEGALA